MTPAPDDDDLDFDALKAAARAATPAPDPARRAETLRLAAENFARHQENARQVRLTSEPAQGGLFQGVRNMFRTMSMMGGLTATTALVAVGFLALTPQGRELVRGGIKTAGEGDVPVVTDMVEVAPGTETGTETIAQTAPPPPAPDAALRRVAPETSAPQAVVAEMEAADAAGTAPAPEVLVAPQAVPVVVGTLGYADAVAPPEADTEAFANAPDNPLRVVAEAPVSTFSIDVDTAAYAVVRQSLNMGVLPPVDAVRVEEMINYFPYSYPAPAADEAPFRPTVTVIDTPWNTGTDLVHIALQGQLPAIADRPPLNLVFLIDTSGSMDDPAKLPLLKQSFLLMLDQLRPEDQIAIVAYAGSAGLVLPPTAAAERSTILTAMQNLGAGGGTAGMAGLEQAYAVARDMAADGEVSRVVLATDGDFNVGPASISELTAYIEDQRDSGVFLSVLGFGRGNLDDATMQALAQNGNGIAAYIDTLNEAQKVLVDQLTGALFAIATDVKVQVEWNPATVAEYRLIGYETRALNHEDFNNDAVDAGDIGAGLSVTAIYEVTPVGSDAVRTDPLRYDPPQVAPGGPVNELGFLRLRWKDPGSEVSELLETPILTDAPPPDAAILTEVRFAVAMAGFGQLLRDSDFLRGWGWDEAIALAAANRGEDAFGYRNEAVRLMRLAQSLQAN